MSTMTAYALWIETCVPTIREAYGACSIMTTRMVEMFPELRRVRGHYLCPIWGRREHWWCVALDGTIIDPTVQQFPSGVTFPGTSGGKYEPWVEGAPEPIGRCMECGAYCWEGKSPSSNACSLECARELEAEYNCSFGSKEI